MIDLISKGGVIMVFIIALSIAAAAIVIERFLYLRKVDRDEKKLVNSLRQALEARRFFEAISICDDHPSPLARLIKVGIEHRHNAQTEIKEAVSSAANREIPRLERFLSALGTIAHISPLLGLLGTVTGNIKSFGVLGGATGMLGDHSLLARGISEALLTTAAGLIVAIPATIFYNHLVNRVNNMILEMENRVNEIVLLIKGER